MKKCLSLAIGFLVHSTVISTNVGPFDVLYPTTHFSKAISMTMQIRSAIAHLSLDAYDPEELFISCEILAGRFALLKNNVDRVTADKNMTNDSIEYLLTIIELMANETKRLFVKYSYEGQAGVVATILAMRHVLELCLSNHV